jgi:hypothetical protein
LPVAKVERCVFHMDRLFWKCGSSRVMCFIYIYICLTGSFWRISISLVQNVTCATHLRWRQEIGRLRFF